MEIGFIPVSFFVVVFCLHFACLEANLDNSKLMYNFVAQC